MLAYDMNEILRIIPDAVGLTKEASVNNDFPLDSRDSVIASALRVGYLTKVAHQSVAYSTQESVNQAVEAYGLTEEVAAYNARITKYASAKDQADLYDRESSLALTQEAFKGGFGYGQDLIKQASTAEDILGRYNGMGVDDDTLRYSSAMPFGQAQLIGALEKRAYTTGDVRYNQIKDVVTQFTVDALNSADREKRASVAKSIATLDREIHYNGDIYREAFVKQASVSIKLKTKTVSFEDIQRLGKDHIGDILGKDVASALTGDAANDKAVLEALPLDEKAALERFI